MKKLHAAAAAISLAALIAMAVSAGTAIAEPVADTQQSPSLAVNAPAAIGETLVSP
ncbi:hypothetical protein [Paenibacillus xanthanilyticus]|uniref:Uncharacterized protein n=1 Tax=Paenibacillus xanthanilyticus TaxID=1783531 RepID=A0ABV8JYZ1_9BACL